MKSNFFFITLYLSILMGCDIPKPQYALGQFERKLVVDGTLNLGETPRIYLSYSIPVSNKPIDTLSMYDAIVKTARVTLSDGIRMEELSVKKDPLVPQLFVYTTNKMIGENGKEYTLNIEIAGEKYESKTKILPAADAKRFLFKNHNDSLYQLRVEINDLSGENYYKIYTFIPHKQKYFVAAFSGTIANSYFQETHASIIPINSGTVAYPLSLKSFETHFNKSDTVYVKICTIPIEGFKFWTAYENELVNGHNPLFPAVKNLPSNISSGGLGIWCGYGSQTYQVVYGISEPVLSPILLPIEREESK